MLTVEESVIIEDKNTQADGKSRKVGWNNRQRDRSYQSNDD